MAKRKILFIEDDPKVEAGVKEILGEYELETVSNPQAAEEMLRKKAPALIIIDHDLKAVDGLQVFRQLHALAPKVKVIMLSSSNSIPLAVSATKMGVADFLRKPVAAQQLKASVEKNIFVAEETFFGPAAAGWLRGQSSALEKFYSELREALAVNRNFILFGERGISKEDVVEFIHAKSPGRNKKIRMLDLSSFRRENQEASFWAAVQEIGAEPAIGSLSNLEDRCGTLYLKDFDTLEENFKQSILTFFEERRGRIDKEIIVVIGVYGWNAVPMERAAGYAKIRIPLLRERKEDIPELLSFYLKFFSEKYGKAIKGVSAELLEYFSAYDYPGNYRELENLLEQSILRTSSEILELKDLPQDFNSFLEFSIKKAMRYGRFTLEEARKGFEADLYRLLLTKSGGDITAVARFLDMPRTILVERLEHLLY